MRDTAEGHRPMRRKDREITDRTEINGILDSAKVLHLALSDDNMPFLVPVFYAYDGAALYFHSAKAGTKIEILKRNNRVCFEVSVDHGIIENDVACDFEARHRTVIGFGTAEFVEDEAEKIKALNMIVGRFTDKAFDYPQANLKATAVVRIAIASIKGKKHGF
ncbi:MAG: pyridoxamine 5'-phosphate oxidase family protein [Humidesulfovibrio sp.]|nr:pyridoxamine 5'-phosphate oxidase family protein [Humidesulfovibrio sp.]